ncbi:hypothetical protein [Saccharibacillus alkalitolerans]|uniref:Uncharacterized protein n=1 Tax=Saccharibacillus alkalitolerans TaxID=2705290 RepID=A0ABX0F9H5_9BACL|nr:hypothetical protein [Saccharibacillus alkalitolerans]NGZ76629.1 hypothetical protein [Saccharibacillus alkalitolerans]
MEEEEILLERYGLEPAEKDREEIGERLRREIGDANRKDNEAMKLLCVLLYSFGRPEDALTIWAAKSSGFDAGIAVESELLIGAGLDDTMLYLLEGEDLTEGAPAAALLRHLEGLQEALLTPRGELLAFYRNYYGTDS